MLPSPRLSLRSVLLWLILAYAIVVEPAFAQQADKPTAKKDVAAAGVAAEKTALEHVAQVFTKGDQNGDKKLSLEEYQAVRGSAEAARRDLQLFDQDGDDTFSLDEYLTIPTAVDAKYRGPVSDPMQTLVNQVLSALDKALDNWNEHLEVEVDAKAFVEAFAKRFEKFAVQPAQPEADPDGNGKVSRDEARRFLEIQFGVRRGDGKLLREPNGCVNHYMLYLYIDLNHNDKLERTEFIERSFGDASVAQEFDAVNTNGDDSLSFDEWRLMPGRAVEDPIASFCWLDKNFDAHVDAAELLVGTPDWKRTVNANAFPGFDLNRDGKLSLTEFRLMMNSNMVLPWHTALTDSDGDGLLSFAEFKFDPPLFPLLRMLYFTRLDVNSSGSLDPKEFTFTVKSPDTFYVMNADGSDWKSFFVFEGHPACGSPAVSPDGKFIAFDGWPPKQQAGSAIYVMSIDGGEPRHLCPGMMPNWSKDGQFLACSRGSHVCLIDAKDGKQEQLVNGWGAQWSPDGRMLAFTQGAALKSYDIKSATLTSILEGEANPYQQIFWNSAWSPDGQRLCFKGVKADGTQEVASVNMTGDKPELKVHHSGKVSVNADFAWHPQGNRLVYAMYCPERTHVQLYEFDPNKNDPPTLMKGQDETRNNTDMCWTPDGKRLIVVSGDY